MMLNRIISIARINATSSKNALLCIEDANKLLEKGQHKQAVKRAMDSLRYSVGIFHNDYKSAEKFAKVFNSQ